MEPWDWKGPPDYLMPLSYALWRRLHFQTVVAGFGSIHGVFATVMITVTDSRVSPARRKGPYLSSSSLAETWKRRSCSVNQDVLENRCHQRRCLGLPVSHPLDAFLFCFSLHTVSFLDILICFPCYSR